MSDWKAVLMVPVIVDIEYARDIHTAQRGAEKLLESYKSVSLTRANGDKITPKLMAIDGPPEEVKEWAEEQKRKRALADSDSPSGPSLGGGDDGPSTA